MQIMFKITFFVLLFIEFGISSVLNSHRPSLPDSELLELLSFSVAIIFALNTTYSVDGKKGKIWRDTLGYEPEKDVKDDTTDKG